ncbi:hypothetical protein E1281_30330 [Actinomadura sp. KC345]|uniref:hypothetical protein n=1 Tax=Actinomadura sp. KC345 TaxID=2530371 RepID=UPI0010526F3A|nr:hypothetical protein [Actinomadura sp. KC345]TDC45462.1 hypothetical protein E1281_30330 [Actinomadura sp. KC345]
MSPIPEWHRRLAGAALVVAGLTAVAVGYAFVTGVPALAAAAPMQLAGAAALVAVTLLTGRSPFRRYDRGMWMLIARLAAGNAIVAIAYIYAAQRLTLGGAAAVVVIGMLSVGFAEIWRHRRTSWGLKHLGGRALVLAGVLMFNQPWHGQADLLGLACAAACAAGAWNVVTVLGRMKAYGLVDQGATVANSLAVPVLFGLVSALPGGGWMTWDLFLLAGLAGLFTLFLPVLLLNAAIRRSPERDIGAIQSLSSPVHAMVAQIGAATGLLGHGQGTTPAEWAAVMLTAGAAFAISLIAERPHDHGGAARRR